MIARAQDKLGQLLEARATYQRILAEQLAQYAPAPFFDAQATAKTELEALVPRIPSVQVFVTGAPSKGVRLTIDSAAAQVGQPLPRDPGEHTVAASAPGRVPATQQITLLEGATAQVTLDLTPEPPLAPPPPPKPTPSVEISPAPAPATTPPPSATAPQRYASRGVITLGFAGVTLGLGAITGTMSSDEVDKLAGQCPDKKCYDDADETYSSARTLATVSTISFVVGSIVAAGGMVLLVIDSGGDSRAKTGLAIGPGWLGVKGGF
jgi:hypothetical protein